MLLPEPLTDKNFWYALSVRFPIAMEVFNSWFDRYRHELGWGRLFNTYEAYTPNMVKVSPPEFGDLPHAMQMGIWFAFVQEKESAGVKHFIDLSDFCLRLHIEEYLEHQIQKGIEEAIRCS